MNTKHLKYSFRFGDLLPGHKFYVDGDFQYEYLTVAGVTDTAGNCWQGNSKRYLSDNVAVTPHDDIRREVIRLRLASIRKACKANRITPSELRAEYRQAIAKTHPMRPETRLAATRELSPAAFNALQDLGLMFYHGGNYLVSGEYPHRMFL